MATLLVLYKTPENPAAFDRHYAEVHIPLAKKIPGLRSYRVSKGGIGAPVGGSGLHLVATLTFDSMAALQSGLASPEGATTAADLVNFAGAGVDMFMFEEADA